MNAFTFVSGASMIADAIGRQSLSDAIAAAAGADLTGRWKTEAQRLAMGARRHPCGSRDDGLSQASQPLGLSISPDHS
jgi:hypothetical protein